ncbi:preprotein translocase subunit YajC [Nocardioides sp. AE5]|uniref:preprotein translocase subunit YajC n=1 Tax=Nocardioides sp. AE5 TaxID=2962573 RepID=UPI0028828EA7|nr:preprotein translocase subunit YajC [Nocardioides sp. AE5]MDT0201458.1 preprotein translocase subunit YajC [Nocardioides sp. AE5]
MNDLYSLLPIIAIFAIFYLLVIRPASRRQKELRAVQAALNVGDEVITNSGFFGVIDSVDDDKVGLRVAPDVVVTIARAAVAGIPPKHDEDESPVEPD